MSDDKLTVTFAKKRIDVVLEDVSINEYLEFYDAFYGYPAPIPKVEALWGGVVAELVAQDRGIVDSDDRDWSDEDE